MAINYYTSAYSGEEIDAAIAGMITAGGELARYAVCDTPADDAAKTITLAGFVLALGAIVAVKFTNANTAPNPTLNVSATGAKGIKQYGNDEDIDLWPAGAVVQFVYDGTYWVVASGTQGPPGQQGPQGEQGETGNGIASINRTSGDGAPGTKDTYTISYTDGSTFTFEVYNGANGTGTGDMTAAVYDPTGRMQDIFAYVDNAVENVSITVDDVPTEGSDNPVSSGGTFEALAGKQDKLTGAAGQVVGFDADGEATAVRGWSNPNLLDNWYFADPINQRNVSGTITDFGYFIDRWKLVSGSVTLSEAGLVLDGTMVQILEQSIGVGTTASVLTAEGVIAAEYDDTNRTFSIAASGRTLIAAKLELGSQQTIAHQNVNGNWVLNDPPPNKALELAKCQRYFVPEVAEWMAGENVPGSGLTLSIPAALRAAPALMGLDNKIYHNGEWISVSAILTRNFITHTAILYGFKSGVDLGPILFERQPALDVNL